MKIVFDLDNTLVDERGTTLRPGAIKLLESLKNKNHTLILWTNSIRERTIEIVKELNLSSYFKKMITREDYDPNSQDGCKDIRLVKGDVIIDDNPEQKKYADKYGYNAIIVEPFTSFRVVSSNEFETILAKIEKLNKQGFFHKLFKK